MSDILGLCSGQFTGFESKPTRPRKPKSLLGTLINDDNSQSSNMDELLGLCSGMFSSKDNDAENESKEDDFKLLDVDIDGVDDGKDHDDNDADDKEESNVQDKEQSNSDDNEEEVENDKERLVLTRKKKKKK